MLPDYNTADLLRQMQAELKGIYEPEEIRAFYFLLLEEFAGIKRTALLAGDGGEISRAVRQRLDAAVIDLKCHRPVQHIIGHARFSGLELQVSPDVLIPRPETEELVGWIIADHKDCKPKLRILDIGTGSGCIALALSASLPDACVMAADCSHAALEIARENARRNDAAIEFFEWDLLRDPAPVIFDKYDIIVSNPPYVRESEKKLMEKNVLEHEPAAALFVTDEDPLIFYKAIFRFAGIHLQQNGKLYLELNEALGRETADLAKDHRFFSVELRKDINGRDRMLRCIR